jgi:hypothetical protein
MNKYRKRKNLIYSSLLSVISLITTNKNIEMVSYLAETYSDQIKTERMEWEKCIMNMMKFYRSERDSEAMSEAVDGNFGSVSSMNDKSFDEGGV